jgi:hypothetical protein
MFEQAQLKLQNAATLISDQSTKLKELSAKALLDLVDVKIKIVADYPDMLNEYKEMKELLEEI